MKFSAIKSVFIVGIKGTAMSGLAVMCKELGKTVTGADVEERFVTDDLLEGHNISYTVGFSPEVITPDIDVVVYAAMHKGINNPIVKRALELGVCVMSQAEFIGILMEKYSKSIAVCGCHGKTTTSALLSYALVNLKVNPTYIVGVPSFNGMWGAHVGQGKYAVVEADEYGINPPLDKTPKFFLLDTKYAIATNIDFDHPDVYDDLHATKHAFSCFFNLIQERTASHGLFACIDDKELMSVVSKFPKEFYRTFGFKEDADMKVTNVKSHTDHTDFELIYEGESLGTFEVSIFGEKNISNAAGVVLALHQMGFEIDKIRDAIKGFVGAKRRFERIGETHGIQFFDDYAHHPSEIEAVIMSVRMRFPGHRLIVVFQPHTFSRTFALKEKFVESLSLADETYIAPIFPSARENPAMYPITSEDLAEYAKNNGFPRVHALKSLYEIGEHLKSSLKKGDIVFTMGAGDVYHLGSDIMKALEG